jgi:NAD(P)-dependent dehydrogenase (short-subunit alcohol dehydrogenase family)
MTKRIVITGSTRGIGYGLADAFLARGCQVTISGRSQESIDAAVAALAAKYNAESVFGQTCDVTDLEQVQRLWDASVAHFRAIDIWINNAGIAQDMQSLWHVPPQRVQAIVETNIVGVVFGSGVAVQEMIKQGHGQLYNMEGAGSDGRVMAGLGIYQSSKAAVRSLNKSLIAETKELPLIVGALSPGMVVTDMLLDPMENDPDGQDRMKRIFNILADRVETVAPWLVDQILQNKKTGVNIKWLTTPKIVWRFASSRFRKRDLFEEQLPEPTIS